MDPFQVRPLEDTLIQLSSDHWILVKKWLTAGEDNKIKTRMVKHMKAGEAGPDGKAKADMEFDIDQMGGLSQAVEYLLDWSMKDLDGKPIVILDKSPEHKQASLLRLPPEGYQAILKAVGDHADKMAAELEARKNGQGSENASPAISPSVGI